MDGPLRAKLCLSCRPFDEVLVMGMFDGCFNQAKGGRRKLTEYIELRLKQCIIPYAEDAVATDGPTDFTTFLAGWNQGKGHVWSVIVGEHEGESWVTKARQL